MKVIYIAGPFRAHTAWAIEQHIRRAEDVALALWQSGFAVICPHTNSRFFHGAAPDTVFLDGDLEILSRCDAIFMVPGYEHSGGAMRELAWALDHRLPVFYDMADAHIWLSRMIMGQELT